MKYLVISLSILSVILCLCILFAILSDNYLDEAKDPLLEAQTYFPAEDFDSILPLLQEAEDNWLNRKDFFSCILSHSELDDLQFSFARMIAFAEEGDMPELRSECDEILRMLEHVRGMDTPRYYNILSVFQKPNLP